MEATEILRGNGTDCQALRNGDTVAVIGGGPAGSSCAIALKRLARARRLDVDVVVFEQKDFLWQGNVCVGVLSPPFDSLLSGLGLLLPPSLIQRRITGYVLHGDRGELHLPISDDTEGATIVIERCDLDGYLLDSAREVGVNVVTDRVCALKRGPGTILVKTESGDEVTAQAVVGAFGIDDASFAVLKEVMPGFRPPPVMQSIMVELPLKETSLDSREATVIHAFLLSALPELDFAAITPRRKLVTVNVAGRGIGVEALDRFLEVPVVRQYIPNGRGHRQPLVGAFPAGFPGNLFADRVIIIGNASGLLRPLKGKGINTAIRTAIAAAEAIIEAGTSAQAFRQFNKSVSDVSEDYRYGTILRHIYLGGRRFGLLDPVMRLAQDEPALAAAFYGMVSGENSYRGVVRSVVRPSLICKSVGAILAARFQGHPKMQEERN